MLIPVDQLTTIRERWAQLGSQDRMTRRHSASWPSPSPTAPAHTVKGDTLALCPPGLGHPHFNREAKVDGSTRNAFLVEWKKRLCSRPQPCIADAALHLDGVGNYSRTRTAAGQERLCRRVPPWGSRRRWARLKEPRGPS